MNEEERGDAFRGIPKLRLLGVLELPWGALGIPKLRLLPQRIPKSIKSLPKNLKTSQHKTQNRKLVSSVSKRKQKTTSRYCNELIIYLCLC